MDYFSVFSRLLIRSRLRYLSIEKDGRVLPYFFFTRGPPVSCQSWFYSRWKKGRSAPTCYIFSRRRKKGGSDPLYKTCIPQYTLARVAFGLMSTAENETSTNSGSVPRRRSFLSFTRNILYYSKYIFNARSPLTGTISSATSMPPVFSQFSYIILPILFPIL